MKSNNEYLYLLIFLLAMIFGSCNRNNSGMNLQHEGLNLEGVARDVSSTIHRMRINDNYTLIVYFSYQDGILDVHYTIDEQIESDTYSLLDLRPDTNISDFEFAIINPNINSITYAGNLISSIQVAGGTTDYDCECSTGESPSDCKVQRWMNKTYCDGVWCSTCSLVIEFNTSSMVYTTVNNSFLILPQN